MDSLADRIEKRMREIPASNSSYISPIQENLGRVLSESLIRRIALEAAAEATGGKMSE